MSRYQDTNQYHDRIIVFLDFLGFRKLIVDTTKDPAHLQKLLGAIDVISSIGKNTSDVMKTHCITQFSDSVALSYSVNEESGVFYLLLDVAFAVVELTGMGFLVRGAITLGSLLHTPQYLVGPAMVRAYELESSIAKYPRVIIDPKLVKIARHAHASHHHPEDEAHYVRGFYTRDADRRYFIDYVSWRSVVEYIGMDADGYPQYLASIARILRSGLKEKNPRILEKYLWLHTRYIHAVEKVQNLPSRHRFRIAEPDICKAIENLPKMTQQADRAQKLIQVSVKQ